MVRGREIREESVTLSRSGFWSPLAGLTEVKLHQVETGAVEEQPMLGTARIDRIERA